MKYPGLQAPAHLEDAWTENADLKHRISQLEHVCNSHVATLAAERLARQRAESKLAEIWDEFSVCQENLLRYTST